MGLSDAAVDAIETIVGGLRPDMSILFVTGAGISADSGLPTYRGVGGLYVDRPTPEGLPIEAILSGPMFERRPELTWAYLLEIERACRGASPNRGHEVIAAMERHFRRVRVLTQNVDGLHRAAGSREVLDIHGDLHDLICTRCDWSATVADYAGLDPLPRCPECGSVARPAVVLFGEMLPVDTVARLMAELDEGFDLVVSVGTSGLFPYIQEPIHRARWDGVPTVEIDPGRTELSDVVDHRIDAGAAEALDALWSRYLGRREG